MTLNTRGGPRAPLDPLSRFFSGFWASLGWLERRAYQVGIGIFLLTFVFAPAAPDIAFYVLFGTFLALIVPLIVYDYRRDKQEEPSHKIGFEASGLNERLQTVREDLEKYLLDTIAERSLSIPRELFDRLVTVGVEIYKAQDFTSPLIPSNATALEEKWINAHAVAFNALATSLCNFLRHVPAFGLSPFSQPLAKRADFAKLSYDVVQPFRHELLKELNIFQDIPTHFAKNAASLTGREKSKNFLWPQDYEGDTPEDYFLGTPLYDLMKFPVPFELKDRLRFDSHWVVGKKDSGKSTFLSHLINYDIWRPNVAVVVIDSQYRLIEGFARMKGLSPMLIGPRYPIPLNPFKVGDEDDAVSLLSYVFGPIFDADPSVHQESPLEYIIRAVAKHPNPNLDVLTDFIIKPDERLIAKLDPLGQKYFDNFYQHVHPASRASIVARIMGLRRHKELDAMLNAETNNLNFGPRLDLGMIFLIDTNKEDLESDRTQLFGRYFIALLHLTMRKRIKRNQANLTPCFVYIDELPDYCPKHSDDVKLRELLDQGRKQNMGLIVAHQRDDQLHPAIRSALADSAIITQCETQGEATISIQGKPHIVTVPRFQYPSRISNEEFAKRYPKEEPKKKPEPKPDDGDVSVEV